jgi:hypothetical protein
MLLLIIWPANIPKEHLNSGVLENIFNATVEPIYIPMLRIPTDGKIILHLDDDDDLINTETDVTPNVLFRKGGLKRPMLEDDPPGARTRRRWNSSDVYI